MKYQSIVRLFIVFLLCLGINTMNVSAQKEQYLLGDSLCAPKQTTALLSGTTEVISVVHGHSIEEIVQNHLLYPHKAFEENYITRYETAPSFTEPYSAGSLNADDIADAANAVKMVRFLAGVPYEQTAFVPELNFVSQHGAMYMALTNQFAHQPEHMTVDQAFYDIAYRGCSEANISAGRSNIAQSVIAGYMADIRLNNITNVGHRRWVINPGNQTFGIGYARYTPSDYQGDRISMHVFSGKGPYECQSDSYIAWPAAGAFPLEYFYGSYDTTTTPETPWSINLGEPYAEPNKEKIVVTLTRTRDNKTWTFDRNSLSITTQADYETKAHLSISNDAYGIRKGIVFRPDLPTLGQIKDGDTFFVHVSGIFHTDGSPAEISYQVNFFDLQAALGITTLTLDKSTAHLKVNENMTLTATLMNGNTLGNTQNLIWSSSEPTVASVAGGVVTALSPGTTTITVTDTENKKTATCTVTVSIKHTIYIDNQSGNIVADYSECCSDGDILLLSFYKNGRLQRTALAIASVSTTSVRSSVLAGESAKAFVLRNDGSLGPRCENAEWNP